MEQHKIDRINELARKAKAGGLTLEEEAEREGLRAEYRAAVRANLTAHLDNTYVVDEQGNKTKLKKKVEY
ncbi:DUF896 domain-containing protein [uncultured Intestinimonas sp.]|uniref:DUF896 domain-containing protein n=1 Tax=uncultured Intestinimonas sp. TaxID=1689265 RepID=UPI0025E2EF35|nr:DUF896 domain-containing protein [uncultured Intestinimonas sp.]